MDKCILITSGKGGVGKSTLTLALAKFLSKADKTVIIIELDSGLRCIDLMLKVHDKAVYDLSDVLSGNVNADKALIRGDSDKLFLLPAAFSPDFTIDSHALNELTDVLSSFCDYIILDSAAGLNVHNLPRCDSAYIVLTPDPISVRDAAKVGNILCDNNVPDVKIIINKVSVNAENQINDFDKIIDETALPLLAVIPSDNKIVNLKNLPEDSLLYKCLNNFAKRVNGANIKLAIK